MNETLKERAESVRSPAATLRQRTLARRVGAEGVGVHSGARVRLRLEPAGEGTGIVFVREDLHGQPEIVVRPEAVSPDALNRMTVLEGAGTDGARPARVGMTEHLLAACVGLGVSNLRIGIDGPECPIFDGSAARYAELIEQAGVVDQEAAWVPLIIDEPVRAAREGAEIVAVPAERMRLTFFAEFGPWGMEDQAATFELFTDDFSSDLAPARTFIFFDQLEAVRAQGLIKGGSLDCALVLRDGRPIDNELRWPDEMARHKLLDLLGDLAVLGRPVAAAISARASGHALNYRFVRELLAKARGERP